MPSSISEILQQSRDRLHGRVGSYLEAAPVEVITQINVSDPKIPLIVANEFASLCVHALLTDSTFYSVANIVLAKITKFLESSEEVLATLISGNRNILLWSSTVEPVTTSERIEELIELLRRLRFSKNEFTEEVNSDLLTKVSAVNEELSLLLRGVEDKPAEPVTSNVLENLLSNLKNVEVEIFNFLRLESTFKTVKFTEVVIKNAITSASDDLNRFLSEDFTSDNPTSELLASLAIFESVIETIINKPDQFGILVTLLAELDIIDRRELLRVGFVPVPEDVVGRREFSTELKVNSVGDLVADTTISKIKPYYFEQELEVAHCENLMSVGILTPTFSTHIISGNLVGATAGLLKMSLIPIIFHRASELPTGHVGELALVAEPEGNYAPSAWIENATLYIYSEGSWVRVSSEVIDAKSSYRINLSMPTQLLNLSVSDTVKLNIGGHTYSRTIRTLNGFDPLNEFTNAYSITFNEFVGTSVNANVELDLTDYTPSVTDSFYFTPHYGSTFSTEFILGKNIKIDFGGKLFRRKIIEADMDGPSLKLTTNLNIKASTSGEVFMATDTSTDFLNQKSVFVSKGLSDYVDLIPSDRLLIEINRDSQLTSTMVIEVGAGVATTSMPLITDADFIYSLENPENSETCSNSYPVFTYCKRFRWVESGVKLILLPTAYEVEVEPPFTEITTPEVFIVTDCSISGISITHFSGPGEFTIGKFKRAVFTYNMYTTLYRIFNLDTGIPISTYKLTQQYLESTGDELNQTLDFKVQGSFVESVLLSNDMVQFPTVESDLRNFENLEGSVTLKGTSGGTVGNLLCLRSNSTDSVTNRFIAAERLTMTDLSTEEVINFTEGEVPLKVGEMGRVNFNSTLDGQYRGPITVSKNKYFPNYAYIRESLKLRSKLDIRELREDLGRALNMLGSVSRIWKEGFTLEYLEGGWRLISDNTFTEDFRSFEGVELGIEGKVNPPIRVSEVKGLIDPYTLSVSLNLPLNTALVYTDLSLSVSHLTTAWHELKKVKEYIVNLKSIINYAPHILDDVVQGAITRLKRSGFNVAASSIANGDFGSWVNPLDISDDVESVASRLESLITGILGRRASPLDM